MAKNILITGGIGTGKSTSAHLFSLLGVPLFIDDIVARELSNNDLDVRNAIVSLFDTSVYNHNVLDRKRVAAMVFNDKKKLSELTNIIHPAVQKSYINWINLHNNAPYTLRESALATNESHIFDAVIVVDAPLQLRINRVAKRDNCSSDEVIKRINNQISQETRLAMANFIVLCNNQELVIPQILKIHNTLLNL